MEPTFVEREGFTVLGVQARVRLDESPDFGAIWHEFMEHHDQIQPLSVEEAYYEVCFGAGEPNVIDCLAGIAVAGDVTAPEGLALRKVPGGRYAVFECTMETISQTWGYAYGTWLPASTEYESACPRPDFEQYLPDGDGGFSRVLVHVAVRRKA